MGFVPFVPVYPYWLQSSLSPEERKEREILRAKESNRKFYPKFYKELSEKFKKDWYVRAIDCMYGGIIYATYKKYPNIYMILNLSYDGNDSEPWNWLKEFKFYVDENHYMTIVCSSTQIYNIQKDGFKDIYKLIDLAINSYYRENSSIKKLEENKLLFYTGKEYVSVDKNEAKQYVSSEELFRFYIDENTNLKQYIIELSDTTKFLLNMMLDDTRKA